MAMEYGGQSAVLGSGRSRLTCLYRLRRVAWVRRLQMAPRWLARWTAYPSASTHHRCWRSFAALSIVACSVLVKAEVMLSGKLVREKQQPCFDSACAERLLAMATPPEDLVELSLSEFPIAELAAVVCALSGITSCAVKHLSDHCLFEIAPM